MKKLECWRSTPGATKCEQLNLLQWNLIVAPKNSLSLPHRVKGPLLAVLGLTHTERPIRSQWKHQPSVKRHLRSLPLATRFGLGLRFQQFLQSKQYH